MSSDRNERALAELTRLASLLDNRYRIPGTRIRFGWDGILGLIPGAGDLLGTGLGLYLLLRARQLGLPRRLQARMLWNLALDGVVGAVPLFGDVFDVAFKANLRNVRLLQAHLQQRGKLSSKP